MPKVQIQIVTWNSLPHLERLFLGIAKQQGVDYNVVVIDNASTDGTAEMLGQNFDVIPAKAGIQESGAINSGSRVKPGMTIRLIRNYDNKGFAAAHNQGFAICQTPYVLVLNPDTELQPRYLEEMLRVMEGTPPPSPSSLQSGGQAERRGLGIASVQGKLYRELPGGRWGPSTSAGRGGIIDSFGLKLMPWWMGWQVVDIGQNTPDKGNFEAQTQVFGATGACALYRLEALRQVADKHGIFDERFGSYKEDVDLAWRLKRAGWKAVFTPQAVAWHGRGVGKGDKRTWRIRYLSLRNHVLMVWKNVF